MLTVLFASGLTMIKEDDDLTSKRYKKKEKKKRRKKRKVKITNVHVTDIDLSQDFRKGLVHTALMKFDSRVTQLTTDEAP